MGFNGFYCVILVAFFFGGGRVWGITETRSHGWGRGPWRAARAAPRCTGRSRDVRRTSSRNSCTRRVRRSGTRPSPCSCPAPPTNQGKKKQQLLLVAVSVPSFSSLWRRSLPSSPVVDFVSLNKHYWVLPSFRGPEMRFLQFPSCTSFYEWFIELTSFSRTY